MEEEYEIRFYRVQFREDGPVQTASSKVGPHDGQTDVMVQTDHGLEPAKILRLAPVSTCDGEKSGAVPEIVRKATETESDKYIRLTLAEESAFGICNGFIANHQLKMNLVRVEKFFNGSKMIFYFTADNRVDFRGLVKNLVQEFRTRVEMRQVGVRHETKMIGGVGTCGRELCCSSFIRKFDSVSIKMAKEQDLPLNPTKISGVCNRLLCCLTYEYDTYRSQRRQMPKAGRRIEIDGQQYLVRKQLVLKDSILVETSAGEERLLGREAWEKSTPVRRKKT